MIDPFRLRVLKALSRLLETINPDVYPDFRHDMREAVFRGRIKYGADDPLPMLSILEAPIPLDVIQSRGANPNSSGQWELLIQGFVKDDHKNPSDPAHLLMAEVKAVLAAEKLNNNGNNLLNLGGRVVDMQIGQGSVRPPDDVSDKAFFWLTLTLRLAERLDQPYY
ncbi:hypothetical protein WKW50_16540 [Ochrobactrum sp. GPK 3]